MVTLEQKKLGTFKQKSAVQSGVQLKPYKLPD